MKIVTVGRRGGRQRGIYALEFALAFLMFFGVLYTLIGYGLLFTMRSGLQNAAEDGARAGLRHQAAGSGTQLALRQAEARRVAALQSSWMPAAPVVSAQVCERQGAAAPVCGQAGASCDARLGRYCQIEVTVTARGLNRMLPLLNFAMPDTLVGRASLLLDGRAM
ncbi:MAG: pilus assembly protein [Comamonadaceae bacterium]|nr:MAG: pilus assembly protein [Comamonadaceae bacterium]